MNRDSKMFVKLINLDFFLDEHTFYAYMNIIKHRFRMEFMIDFIYWIEQVTSAIVHPHCIYMEQSEACFGTGSILGERLPEEDVRVVETVDNPHQQDVPVLPGAQRRKLYFNPAYFDRQLLLVRSHVISSKHKDNRC